MTDFVVRENVQTLSYKPSMVNPNTLVTRVREHGLLKKFKFWGISELGYHVPDMRCFERAHESSLSPSQMRGSSLERLCHALKLLKSLSILASVYLSSWYARARCIVRVSGSSSLDKDAGNGGMPSTFDMAFASSSTTQRR